jgi:hypothetical protein
MLSNCEECQYFHPEACGVNPIYREKTEPLRSKLTAPELEYFANELQCCPDWKRSPDLDLLTHELTLTREQWHGLAQAIAQLGLADALPEELRPTTPEASGEIDMIEVESSNIEAIGWRAGVCQVDFLSGSRYQYSDVPEWVFQEFLEADSKGRFLNQVFKIDHSFEYEQI